MSGKIIRLNRLFRKSSRLFIVPMDHGVTVGPIDGIKNIQYMVKTVADNGADAVIVHKGLTEQIAACLHPSNCELIIHLSASTSMAPDSNQKELVSSVEQAVRLGASAVSVHINLGAKSEAAMLSDLGRIADQCDLWGIPLLAMMYVRDGKPENEYNPGKIKHAARVAEELGADIIKVNYTGSLDSFADVVSSVNVPVLIAGGPKLNTAHDLLVMVADALQAGARGVAIGRNVFQDPDPAYLVQMIRRILDQNISSQMILELEDLAK